MFSYANKEHGLGAVQVVKSTCQTYFSSLTPLDRLGQEEIASQHIGLKAVCPMTGPQPLLITQYQTAFGAKETSAERII